jgi:hypothetical protein
MAGFWGDQSVGQESECGGPGCPLASSWSCILSSKDFTAHWLCDQKHFFSQFKFKLFTVILNCLLSWNSEIIADLLTYETWSSPGRVNVVVFLLFIYISFLLSGGPDFRILFPEVLKIQQVFERVNFIMKFKKMIFVHDFLAKWHFFPKPYGSEATHPYDPTLNSSHICGPCRHQACSHFISVSSSVK